MGPETINQAEPQLIPGDGPPEEALQRLTRRIEDLLLAGDRGAAWHLLSQLHPADRAGIIDSLRPEFQPGLLAEMGAQSVAELLEFLEPDRSAGLLSEYGPSDLAPVLDLAEPDVAADVLIELPQQLRLQTIEEMTEPKDVTELLQYPQGSAGSLMTPEFPVVNQATTTPNALDQLRLLGPAAEEINSVLVVNDVRALVGSVSLARLALARPNLTIEDIMDPSQLSVSTSTDREEAAQLMQRYNLAQLPVTEGGQLVGVILAEDMVDVVQEEATEDMFRIAGVGEERVLGPIGDSMRSRFPWLLINLCTVFLAAAIIGLFESTVAKVVALAVFLPVVAGQGGIGGTQTVTLVVRGMALGQVPRRFGFRLLRREVVLGLLHGLSLGVIVGLVAMAWKGNPALGLVLGLAMLGNMLVASLAGAGVPLLLRQFRQDPAVSSAVFVTTFTDVLGFALFLGLAAALIKFLV